MEISPSPSEEVRLLADALFDGRIEPAQVQRLDTLIFNDQNCLQVYLERMTFHAEVLKQAEGETSGRAVTKDFSRSIRQRQRHERMKEYGIFGFLVALLLIAASSILSLTRAFQPAPVGTVSGLSANLQMGGNKFELGQVVRQGETFTVKEGIVSLQLPHALVDVLGPATVRLENSQKLSLTAGRLLARILTPATRLVIATPDVEVLDLGTEFLVEHKGGEGTSVSVRQGRVQASLLDWRGQPARVLELSDHRSAEFRGANQSVKETEFRSQSFLPVDRSRGGIRSIDGALRVVSEAPGDLRSLQVQTANHVLVIPELQNVVLEQELIVQGLEGPVHLPAGATVSSYLIHYDPPGDISRAPRGAVTFFGRIAGIAVSTSDLAATDQAWGLPDLRFEPEAFRGLELGLDEDEVLISGDRRTASFRFDASPPKSFDEARVFVVSEAGGF